MRSRVVLKSIFKWEKAKEENLMLCQQTTTYLKSRVLLILYIGYLYMVETRNTLVQLLITML